LLWVKRLLPIILIALGLVGYRAWEKYRLDRRAAETRRWADLTTTIWEASARYYDQPDSFLAFRDSVLAADSLSLADVQAYLKQYSAHPEKYIDYARLVYELMDSLEKQRLAPDSLTADTIKTRPFTPPPKTLPDSAPSGPA